MSRKPKFKPTVTRVKLNPEQAVLQCLCYNTNQRLTEPADQALALPGMEWVCVGKASVLILGCQGPAFALDSGTIASGATSS